ncbi:6-phosphogluconolactonase [bacterium]|nr:6-phosphogluconolactonase [bacterium]
MTVCVLPNTVELVLQAAEAIVSAAETAVQDHGCFTWAVAGGTTPRQLYQTLTQTPWVKDFPWQQTQLFFTDERCVPLEHEDSNYRMLKQTLLDEAPIPAANVHQVPMAADSPESIAQCYEDTLQEFFRAQTKNAMTPTGFPAFDLILLGLGSDGHTASLFPNSQEVLEEKSKWAVAALAPHGNPPGYRITLTLPVINAARQVIFLVTGDAKKEIISEVLQPKTTGPSPYPAGLVKPQGKLTWFLDQAAGSLLTTSPKLPTRQQQ